MNSVPAPHGGDRRRRLQPLPARWFELLIARDDLTLAVETLARTGSVELETHSETTTRQTMPDLHSRMEEYHRLAQRYRPYWPLGRLPPSTLPGHPSETLDASLGHLRSWVDAAEPHVHRLELLNSERADLELLGEMVQSLHDSPLQLSLLREAGPSIAARLFVLPPRTHIAQWPPSVLIRQSATRTHDFLVAVGPLHEIDTLEQELAALKGRRMPLHPCLTEEVSQSRAAVQERLAQINRDEASERERIGALADDFGLREALGNLNRLEWFLTHVQALPVTENFAWITGWTSDMTGEKLTRALDEAGVRALLRFPDPPRDRTPPVVMHNPWWAQPFELFAKLLGTPSRDEADPSRLLAVIAPLLFGYMFGDLGQGAVLFGAGLLLARRLPALRLLVPAGLSSMIFGLLFGSLFGLEDVIPPLWLRPIDAPITILAVPLLGGVFILVLGMALNGLEAYWRGQLALWWRVEAGMVLLYLSAVAGFFEPMLLWLTFAGLLWYLGGSVALAWPRPLAALAGSLGLLLETTLQLGVNTLSFARVGAFALAHAGLSAAIVALAQSSGHAVVSFLILFAGNAVVILLEGLVVSIQITRLVLFEFFIRFLRGEGRTFKPLTPPAR